ncbi:E3 ubiquitin-protein ligase znrf2 isoform X2 [Narcine bancroftii]|uniref:E3 ubiquitin-protein ligase znrf2 isoform X2 n=1 Tax=Narcine bancroftii TaxID=1343680 RepID=UPI0038316D19
MGAKQSSPAANGRTRAYSGSDLPSSTAASGGGGSSRSAPGSSGSAAAASSALAGGGRHHGATPPTTTAGPGAAGGRHQSLSIPHGAGAYSSPEESEGSTPEEGTAERSAGHGAPRLLIGSLPAHLSPRLFGGFKCPVCSKFVSTDEMDLHLVMCLTKPRVTYNAGKLQNIISATKEWQTFRMVRLGEEHQRMC